MNALQRLKRGEAVFGLFQTFPDPGATELALWCGYDFVILDCEHGIVDETAQLNALRTLYGGAAFSLARVRAKDEGAVARYLDFGADGVIVPDVRDAHSAQNIARAATSRWTGGLRFDRYGLEQGRQAKQTPLLLVLIESPEGVQNIESILDVEGISGVIVGSGDLSTRLGAPGDFATPAYVGAVDRVEQAARSRGKILGGKAYPGLPLRAMLERGYRVILVGRDAVLFRSALTEALVAAKQSSGLST